MHGKKVDLLLDCHQPHSVILSGILSREAKGLCNIAINRLGVTSALTICLDCHIPFYLIYINCRLLVLFLV